MFKLSQQDQGLPEYAVILTIVAILVMLIICGLLIALIVFLPSIISLITSAQAGNTSAIALLCGTPFVFIVLMSLLAYGYIINRQAKRSIYKAARRIMHADLQRRNDLGKKSQGGQGLVEYALILVIVAIVVIAATTVFPVIIPIIIALVCIAGICAPILLLVTFLIWRK